MYIDAQSININNATDSQNHRYAISQLRFSTRL